MRRLAGRDRHGGSRLPAMIPEFDSTLDPVRPPDPTLVEEASAGVTCDFCGQVVGAVRRVALDGEYERLRTRHQVRYSCEPCFEKKERERQSTAG